jgi:hypothetical protein
MSESVTIPFSFPGEGAVVDGVFVTADTPMDDRQLDHLAVYGIRGTMTDSTIGSALTQALQEADESFVARLQERLEKGDEKYGQLRFLEVDTLEEAMKEVLDLANYARFTYIKLFLLQRAATRTATKSPLTDRQGFVSLKEMFGGKE